MESMNKFKILTIIFICLFVFVVGAIYSNTKDVSTAKSQIKTENADAVTNAENTVQVNENQDLVSQIDMLNRRVDELNEKLNNVSGENANSTGLNCRIYGNLTSNGVEQLSPETAVQEAKINNSELVLTCTF